MFAQLRDYSHLLGNLKGISDVQLEEHFTLYEGYVESLNTITEQLESMGKDKKGNYAYSPFAELKRRFPVAYNGVYLHELYFDNLSSEKGEPDKTFNEAIKKEWGTVSAWKEDVCATGMAGPGWVITGYEPTANRIQNLLITEHHIGWPVDHVPIMVLDMWEHAFFFDYKTDKKAYMNAFFDNLDWDLVNRRFEAAQHVKGVSAKRVQYNHAVGA